MLNCIIQDVGCMLTYKPRVLLQLKSGCKGLVPLVPAMGTSMLLVIVCI